MNLKIISLTILLGIYLSSAQSNYDNHVFFANSLTDGSYYYSQGIFSSPSKLSLVNTRLPVESFTFYNPPNSLKLDWISGKAGNWQAAINIDKWRNRDVKFYGKILSFWCFTEDSIRNNELPKVFIEDWRGEVSSPVNLKDITNRIPTKKWTQIKIPLNVVL